MQVDAGGWETSWEPFPYSWQEFCQPDLRQWQPQWEERTVPWDAAREERTGPCKDPETDWPHGRRRRGSTGGFREASPPLGSTDSCTPQSGRCGGSLEECFPLTITAAWEQAGKRATPAPCSSAVTMVVQRVDPGGCRRKARLQGPEQHHLGRGKLRPSIQVSL